jgi:anti-sigma B factor antagonist
MQHAIREEPSGIVVRLEGDVDLENSPRAREVLLDCVGRGKPVVVDMSGVGYMDSSGVASLVEAFQLARRKDTGFGLAALTDGARRVLELARLDRVFHIFDSVEDGLRGNA